MFWAALKAAENIDWSSHIRRHIGAVPRALSIAEQAMAMGKEYPYKKD